MTEALQHETAFSMVGGHHNHNHHQRRPVCTVCGRCATAASSSSSSSLSSSASLPPAASDGVIAGNGGGASRPKRDYRFQVIQVRQGPKWFILPSSASQHHQHYHKDTEKEKAKNNNNNNTNSNVDNNRVAPPDSNNNNLPLSNNNTSNNTAEVNQSDEGKAKINNGYASLSSESASSSDQENAAECSCGANAFGQKTYAVPSANQNSGDDPSEYGLGGEGGLMKVTATNQMHDYPAPLSEPTTRRFPPCQRPIVMPDGLVFNNTDAEKNIVNLQQQQQLLLQQQQLQFEVDKRELRHQRRVNRLAQRLREQQRKQQQKQQFDNNNNNKRSASVVVAPPQPAIATLMTTGFERQQTRQKCEIVSVPTSTVAANRFSAVLVPSETGHPITENNSSDSGLSSTSMLTACPPSKPASSSSSSGCGTDGSPLSSTTIGGSIFAAPPTQATSTFEILAVSRKDDEDEEEDDDDVIAGLDDDVDDDPAVTAETEYFADSGYCLTTTTRANSRSGSIVEYFSNSGCYTCIVGGEDVLLPVARQNSGGGTTDADETSRRLCLCVAPLSPATTIAGATANVEEEEDGATPTAEDVHQLL